MMNYDQEIFKVLTEAGENGLKAEKVARHVFNACNSLFCPASYDDVHRYVAQFLQRSARNPDSISRRPMPGACIFSIPMRTKRSSSCSASRAWKRRKSLKPRP